MDTDTSWIEDGALVIVTYQTSGHSKAFPSRIARLHGQTFNVVDVPVMFLRCPRPKTTAGYGDWAVFPVESEEAVVAMHNKAVEDAEGQVALLFERWNRNRADRDALNFLRMAAEVLSDFGGRREMP